MGVEGCSGGAILEHGEDRKTEFGHQTFWGMSPTIFLFIKL